MQRNIDTLDVILSNILGIVNSKYIPIFGALGNVPKKRLSFQELFQQINKVKRIKKSTLKSRITRLKKIEILEKTRETVVLLNKGEYLFQFSKDLDGNVAPIKKDPLNLKVLELMEEEKSIDPSDFKIFPKNFVRTKLRKFQKYDWIEADLSLPGSTVYKFTNIGTDLKSRIFNLKDTIGKNVGLEKSQIISLDWEMVLGLKYRRLLELFMIGTAINSIHRKESDTLLIQEFNLSRSIFITMKRELERLKWVKNDEKNIIPTDKGQKYFEKHFVSENN